MPLVYPINYFQSGKASVKLPAGTILAWNEPIAEIPSGWFLCNGSNGTPNLADKFILGSGGGYTKGMTGGSLSAILTLNNGGAHTGGGLSVAWGLQHPYKNASAGNHNHTVTITLPLPPTKNLVFIQCLDKTKIPEKAVVCQANSVVKNGFNIFSGGNGRFFRGKNDNTRILEGVSTRNYSGNSSTNGNHNHNSSGHGTRSDGGGASPVSSYAFSDKGNHNHPITGSTNTLPAFCVLMMLQSQKDILAPKKLVAAYNGLISDLFGPWRLADGTDGAPNLSARMIRGLDTGLNVGDIGGQTINESVNFTVTGNASHNHATYMNMCNIHDEGSCPPTGANHGSFSWTHSHLVTGNLPILPPFHVLDYIYCDL